MSTLSRSELDELTAGVRTLPEVHDAVAVVRTVAVREASRPAREASGPAALAPVANPAPAPAGPIAEAPLAEADGGDLVLADTDPATLQQALLAAAEQTPHKGTTYVHADGSEDFQSYRELLDDAQRLLEGLRTTGIAPGDSVLFQFGDNRNFVTAFWACVLGGYLPTPVSTAPRYDEESAVTRKLRNSWELLGRPLVLTDSDLLPRIRGLAQLWDVDDLRIEATEALRGNRSDAAWFPATPDDPALHLLTSGSTGTPKCVRHSHRSIVARTRAAALANGFNADDVSLNWMPLDHVGGIVMYNVRDVILQCAHVNAEISAFLTDPLRWLDWVDRFRVTNTWAPNFAFALVNDLADAARDRAWDLSSLRHICNAGEAVVPRTAHRYLSLLRPHGLPADAMRPCWGMSETSSGITYSTLSNDDERLGTVRVDKRSLGGSLDLVDDDESNGITFTEVGTPVPGIRLRIVNSENTVLPELHVGRLQVSGPTLMTGYHRNAEANREAFTADGWFNTGDLAFLAKGRLTITGRDKDVVIIRGANHLTYDIESVVELVDGTETTLVAACGYEPDNGQAEQLAVFFVPSSDDPAAQRTTISTIRTTLARDLGLHADLVIPVKREQFPKTDSGKIQRAQLISDLANGVFAEQLEILDGDNESAGWLFERVWLTDEPSQTPLADDGVWLLFTTDPVLEEAVRAEAPSLVTAPPDSTDIEELLHRVRSESGPITAVLHTGDALSILTTLQALASAPSPLLVLTRCGLWVRPGDNVEPLHATLPGLIRTAVVEETLPFVRQVDLPANEPGQWGPAIRTELACRDHAAVVAHRSGQRLVPRVRSVEAAPGKGPVFVPGGTYLVTGGLGGIGLVISEHLLAAYGAKLLLVGRSRDADLTDLTTLGEVDYRVADVSDANALRAAVEHAERRWEQPLSGVLHLAGADISDLWQNLEQHTLLNERPEMFGEMYRAKVSGTLAIAELLTDRPDATLVLFSSTNAEFGGRSFGAYSSANSFLNGFADYWAHARGRIVWSLSWSMWAGLGMNRGSTTAAAQARGFRVISEEAGIAALTDALALSQSNLLVGLDPGNPFILREMVPEQLSAAEVVVAYTAPVEIDAAVLQCAVAGFLLPVQFIHVNELPPDTDELLAAASAESRRYVKPETELESHLAAIWTEVLKRPRISRDDSFFEIGGNSMRAVQLVSRISSTFGTQVPLHHLYENPTISALADVLTLARDL